MNMGIDEFHNGLRVLLNIDMPDFLAAGGSEKGWPAFRDNPHMEFIHAPDAVADGLWAHMQTRMK